MFAGQVGVFRGRRQLLHPDYELLDADVVEDVDTMSEFQRRALIPVYPATAKVSSWLIARSVEVALQSLDHVDDMVPGHVYDENECIFGNAARSYPAFPSEVGRLRLALGGAEGEKALGADCTSGTDGYPWRWGLGPPLPPGETRTVVGYVRFRNQGASERQVTLRPTLIYEYVQVFQPAIGATTLRVMADSRGPEVSGNHIETGQPLASVYQLLPAPDDLLRRTSDPVSIAQGDFVGTFEWDGSAQDWGLGGPLDQSDRFVVTQVRPFLAPYDGTYYFELSTDDGSWLWIDGNLVVANGGVHGPASVMQSVWLQAGVHTLAVKYFEGAGAAYARYLWYPPYGPWETVPVLRSLGAPRRGDVYGAGEQWAVAADDFGGRGVNAIQYFDYIDGSQEPIVSTQAGAVGKLSLGHGYHWIWYRVIDRAGLWSSDKLSPLITVDTTPPSTTMTATPQGNGDVALQWLSSYDASRFEIKVCDALIGNWTYLGSFTGNTHTFRGTPGSTYYFMIRGWDGLNWEGFKFAGTDPRFRPNKCVSRSFMPIIGR
jgi:hypothetical protein